MTDLVTDFDSSESKKALWEYLKTLTGEYCVKIKKKPKRRSTQQNKYYRYILKYYIATFIGCSPEAAGIYMKRIFLVYFFKEDGTPIFSTADLSTLQMEDYLEMIRSTFLLTFNFRIPLPNEVILEDEYLNFPI